MQNAQIVILKNLNGLERMKNIKTLTKNNIYLVLIKKNNNYTLFNNKFNIENFNCVICLT